MVECVNDGVDVERVVGILRGWGSLEGEAPHRHCGLWRKVHESFWYSMTYWWCWCWCWCWCYLLVFMVHVLVVGRQCEWKGKQEVSFWSWGSLVMRRWGRTFLICRHSWTLTPPQTHKHFHSRTLMIKHNQIKLLHKDNPNMLKNKNHPDQTFSGTRCSCHCYSIECEARGSSCSGRGGWLRVVESGW